MKRNNNWTRNIGDHVEATLTVRSFYVSFVCRPRKRGRFFLAPFTAVKQGGLQDRDPHRGHPVRRQREVASGEGKSQNPACSGIFPAIYLVNASMQNANGSTAGSSSASGEASAPLRNSKRPKSNYFFCKCRFKIYTAGASSMQTYSHTKMGKDLIFSLVISVFTLIGIIFVPIGLAALAASNKVVEIVYRYDDDCVPPNMVNMKVAYIQNDTIDKTCTKTLKVPKHMSQPIYVYYQLDNFYQNHRRYVKSRNDAQLRKASEANETSGCDPERTANGAPIVPCGLIAWSLFNDTYSFAIRNRNLTVNKKDISWKSDRDHKFGKDVYPRNFQNSTLRGGAKLNLTKPRVTFCKLRIVSTDKLMGPVHSCVQLSEQEDLIVWMRTAALPTFRKLYGRIEQDLVINDAITVQLQNNYNTYSFSGKKTLVLSTSSWIGGKNDFLGIAYLTVGGLCFFLAVAFTIVYLVKPRKLGDPSYLSWNRNPAGH
ncbi:hypothetical protein ZIOFF_039018 [Zingiber officinale]|uniref:ALA-interacting subunit n=1 Tax=Zingiber officinale TaxID=94328 RepID=A0A8J5G440_ZINOF|nr:hypothetical protein ZIOFF_039018 [Zingiber officinale]